MSYLIGFHWAWLLVAMILGVVMGWFTYLRPRTRWMDGLVWIVTALVALAAVVAISTVIPGRPGYWLEVAVLMVIAYIIGCPVGWALRHQAFRDPASAADHDSQLPKPGYVFPGGILGGATIPAALVPAAAAIEPALAAPIVETSMMPSLARTPSEAAASGAAPPTPAIIEEASRAAVAAAPGTATSPTVPKGIRVLVDSSPPEPTPAAELTSATVAATAAGTFTAPAGTNATPQKMPPLPDDARHAGVRPDGFVAARDNKADDLKRIKGIGPQNEGRLHGLGIWHFDQIGAWTPDNVRWVGSYLAFHGRIEREKWIDQAKALASGQATAFSTRVAAGKVATSKDDGSLGQDNVDGSMKPHKR